MEHSFTEIIYNILKKNYPRNYKSIFDNSLLLQYINQKTKSANKGAKARSSFSNLYALYVIIEDYIENDYHKKIMIIQIQKEQCLLSYLIDKDSYHLGINYKIILLIIG